ARFFRPLALAHLCRSLPSGSIRRTARELLPTFHLRLRRCNALTIQPFNVRKAICEISRRDPVCFPHVVTFPRSRSTSGVSRSPCLLCSSRLAEISPLFGRRLTLSVTWQFLPA